MPITGRMRTPLLAILALCVAAVARASDGPLALLPQPAEVHVGSGTFTLGSKAALSCDAELERERTPLATAIQASTGLDLATARTSATLRLQHVAARSDLGDEGYALHVTPAGVTIEAATPAGAFYGVQTLRQLLPTHAPWAIPCVDITDRPRFAWRGFMLDVSRHFYDVAEVEAVLDQMAALKLNVFHWHLTDDNGWRIEIKRYPKLTRVGAWHAVTPMEAGGPHVTDGRYGGFYTQDQVREVVAYAASRHIAVVPEVDVPGHCSAAMTAYPELAPDNGWTPVVATGPKVPGERCGAMCVGKDVTVRFCHDVIDELLPLFPGRYIHIGGDEVFYDQWTACPISRAAMARYGCKDMADLQVHFTNELIGYVESKGRHAIIWNNLYRPTVDKRAINQFWRDMNPARDFANGGYTVLVSYSARLYFDHHPAMEKAYAYDPMAMPKPGLTPEAAGRVPGIEGCAWTERFGTAEQLRREMFPLLYAQAEVAWTPLAAKDWGSFQQRVAMQPAR